MSAIRALLLSGLGEVDGNPREARALPCRWKDMRALRWIVVGLLVWGLFTGIAYVLVPLLTDGWGNEVSFVAGLALIGLCTIGLLRLDPRRT